MQNDAGASKAVLFFPFSLPLMLPEASSGGEKGKSLSQENTEGDHGPILPFSHYRLSTSMNEKKKSLNATIPTYDYLVALDISINDRLFLGLK